MAKRGSAVIKARGASSAASAANAIVDSLRSITSPTPSGDCFSAAVLSDGSYEIPAGLIYSFPLVSKGAGDWSIVPGVPIDADARKTTRRLRRRVDQRARRDQRAARPGDMNSAGRRADHDGRGVSSALLPQRSRFRADHPGVGVGVQADDAAAGSAAVDGDRAGFGRVGRAVVADRISRLDFQVEPLGDGRRNVPDELAGVIQAVGDRLPLRCRPDRGARKALRDLGGR